MEWIEKRFIVSSKNIHVIWLDFGGKEKKNKGCKC